MQRLAQDMPRKWLLHELCACVLPARPRSSVGGIGPRSARNFWVVPFRVELESSAAWRLCAKIRRASRGQPSRAAEPSSRARPSAAEPAERGRARPSLAEPGRRRGAEPSQTEQPSRVAEPSSRAQPSQGILRGNGAYRTYPLSPGENRAAALTHTLHLHVAHLWHASCIITYTCQISDSTCDQTPGQA